MKTAVVARNIAVLSILALTLTAASSAAWSAEPAPRAQQMSIYRKAYIAGFKAGWRKAATRDTNSLQGGSSSASGDVSSPFGLSADWKTFAGAEGMSFSALRFNPSYQLSPSFSTSATVGTRVAFTDDSRAKIEDARLIFSHSGGQIARGVSFKAKSELLLPFSVASRNEERLSTSIKLLPKFCFDLSEAGMKGLDSYLLLNASRRFHRSDVSASGSANTRTNFSPEVGTGYAVSKAVSVYAGFARTFSWNTAGDASDGYEHYQELGWTASPQVSLALGHYNEGPLTPSDSLAFWSDAGSSIYGALTYTF
ncbi:MAG: hypothetical protein IT285_01200 [Bdellovibrionales bacterium]|nr:hypothetical protein [Bdellovibrionales bacterium]